MMSAEEFEQQNAERFESYSEMMVSFAKMHVEKSLKTASVEAKTKTKIKARTYLEYSISFPIEVIDKQSIINSYPLTNIT